jgi:hypothetical protein
LEQLDESYNASKVDNQCNVLISFYNYILYHDVCPEYKDDILSARTISEQARIQLKSIQNLIIQFPTPFNKACSVLFGGEWQQFFGYNSSWGGYDDEENPQLSKGDA